MIMPGKDPGGFFVTMLIGIAGAILGGWLSSLLFDFNPSMDNWSSKDLFQLLQVH